MKLLCAVVAILACCSCSNASRILAIFPTPSISHQLPLQAFMKGLAARGHQVTVLSPDPLKVPVANYTDIDLSFCYQHMKNIDFTALNGVSAYKIFRVFVGMYAKMCHLQLDSPQIKEFIRTNTEPFDLVVYEMLGYQCFFGLIHRLGSPPIVGITTLPTWNSIMGAMGNPNHPAYSPDAMMEFSDHMTFSQRVRTTIYSAWTYYFWYYEVHPQMEAIMRQYFGDAPPPVAETERNISLLLVGNHWTLDYPRPIAPNVIEMTGIHVKATPSPLPKDVKKFLDEAKDGAIYFSLGSNVRSSTLPEEKRREILDAFSQLPQRVLWKWEADSLPGQPANVMVGKWLPQQDILAHKNIKLFITQGGLQSFQEAAHYAVPLLGIPFWGDQGHNVMKFESAGIGIKLDFNDLTKDSLLKAINKMISDPRYRQNMQQLSAIYRDHEETSLANAVYWTEYVIRHKGAKHLRSAALDLAWYQYLLLDVIAFLAGSFLLAVAVVYLTVRKVYLLLTSKQVPSKLKKK